ncbi:hypothetical protein TCAL_02958, partial [Tigriopus californicus]
MEVERGLQDCDQLMKWIGDKLKSRLLVESAGVVDGLESEINPSPTMGRPRITIRQPDLLRDYRKLAEVNRCNQEQQVANLRSFLDSEMREKLRISIEVSDDTDLSVEEILDKIQEFFRAQYNVILDKVKFHKTIQHSNQRFEDF